MTPPGVTGRRFRFHKKVTENLDQKLEVLLNET
jgi:hypothetical protein